MGEDHCGYFIREFLLHIHSKLQNRNMRNCRIELEQDESLAFVDRLREYIDSAIGIEETSNSFENDSSTWEDPLGW